jgi:hypothetical protein
MADTKSTLDVLATLCTVEARTVEGSSAAISTNRFNLLEIATVKSFAEVKQFGNETINALNILDENTKNLYLENEGLKKELEKAKVDINLLKAASIKQTKGLVKVLTKFNRQLNSQHDKILSLELQLKDNDGDGAPNPKRVCSE